MACAIQALKIKLNLENVLHIDVRREFVLVDALQEGKKKKFSAEKSKVVTMTHIIMQNSTRKKGRNYYDQIMYDHTKAQLISKTIITT